VNTEVLPEHRTEAVDLIWRAAATELLETEAIYQQAILDIATLLAKGRWVGLIRRGRALLMFDGP
jgi:hypothetical protein